MKKRITGYKKGFILVPSSMYAHHAASIYNPSFYKMAPMDDGEPP